MTNNAAHFQILRHEIENIENPIENNTEKHEYSMRINEKIKFFIKKHKIIIDNVKSINFIFSFASLIEIICGSLVICGYSLQFLVSIKHICLKIIN